MSINKLPIINYRIATHAGTANKRLASEANAINLIPIDSIPENYKKEFAKLRQLIEIELNNLPQECTIPVRIGGMMNRTSVKYIILLMSIEAEMEE